MSARALQQTYRAEIIPVDKRKQTFQAINPVTGLPWVFLFVDNTSHSAGTYESPYHTLLTAQQASSENEAIYVFPGDGTSTGMNQGFTMQAGQKLWGSGINNFLPTQQGLVAIPAQTTTLPLITTSSTQAIITMSDNCEVAGLNCSSASGSLLYGIQGGDPVGNTFTVANPSLRGNIVDTPNVQDGAIGLSPTGVATLIDCQATGGTTAGGAIFIHTGHSVDTLTANLSNCKAVTQATTSIGILIQSENNLTTTLTDCQGYGDQIGFYININTQGTLVTTLINSQGYGTSGSITGDGILVTSTQGDITATLINCYGQGPTGGGGSDGILLNPTLGNLIANLTNSQGQGAGSRPGITLAINTGDLTASLTNCQGLGGSTGAGIYFTNNNGNVIANLTNCQGTGGTGNFGIDFETTTGNITANLMSCAATGGGSGAGGGINFITNTTGNILANLSSCSGTGLGTGTYGMSLITATAGDINANLTSCTGTGQGGGVNPPYAGIALITFTSGSITANLTSCTGIGTGAGAGLSCDGINFTSAGNITTAFANSTGTGIGTGSYGVNLEAPSGSLTVNLSGNPSLSATGDTTGIVYGSPSVTVTSD